LTQPFNSVRETGKGAAINHIAFLAEKAGKAFLFTNHKGVEKRWS